MVDRVVEKFEVDDLYTTGKNNGSGGSLHKKIYEVNWEKWRRNEVSKGARVKSIGKKYLQK